MANSKQRRCSGGFEFRRDQASHCACFAGDDIQVPRPWLPAVSFSKAQSQTVAKFAFRDLFDATGAAHINASAALFSF
ncbi:hypothetical protein HDG34_001652 [Paraburkholderia sp. HC6.4b]|uniref:hypothetical protein n=1 Tax=unclassified Paraburkholderia TaxID=2615204 RepID=UPI00161B7307|nr:MULTISPECIES: hypothetical protein [unclassified Paraburkholderia]MBB5407720.1 hypothetical protein [Paraburkholderia sp. HC6.4b]MBB5452267.1 hypothetical protein [Paraburkholderia sp. Kb1A]